MPFRAADPPALPGSAVSTVEIVEHQSSWPEAFRTIAGELSAVAIDGVVSVEHIGSTAVPGLCAKPVIDVLVGVEDLIAVQGRIAPLREIGYRYRPEHEAQIPQRRYFVKEPSGDVPRVHVHVVVHAGPLWQDHIAFRDALRRDAGLRDRYAALKRELAARLDKSAYTEAKAPFVQAVLRGLAQRQSA